MASEGRTSGKMDVRGIALVILLILLSGAIAYIGDNVGRKVGKKRISLFNLRPKYTSIIITICTGAMIVSVTLGGLFLFSDYARKSFFGLQKIIRELSDKKKELEVSTKEYRRQEAKLGGEIDDNLRELKKKQNELDDILGRINMKSVELSELQGSNKKLLKDKEKLEGEMRSLVVKKEQLEKEVADSAEQVSEVSVDTLYGEVLYKKDQLLARVTVTSDIAPDELRTRLILTFKSILSEASAKGAIVGEDSSAIFEQQFKALLGVVRESRNDLIVDALAANNVFKGQPIYIKLHPIEDKVIFDRGEIITSRKVAAGRKREDVEKILIEMLYKVSTAAKNYGMIPDPETQRVGSISFPRYTQVVNDLTDSRADEKISVISLEQTRVSGRLKIDFAVE
jgi:hypothetical protein